MVLFFFFKISQNKIWKFGWILLLAKFGSERVKIYIPHTKGVPRSSQQPFQTVLEAQSGPAKWNEVTKLGFNVCKGFKFGAFASIKEAYIS